MSTEELQQPAMDIKIKEAQDKKLQRRVMKSAFTRQVNKVQQKIAEGDLQDINGIIEQLKAAFHKFEDAHELYHDSLETEIQIDESEEYFTDVQRVYIDTLHKSRGILRVGQVDEVQQMKSEQNIVKSKDESVSASRELLNMLSLPKIEIMKFNGDPMSYHAFINMFDETVDVTCDNEKIKLTRLLQYTTGKAHEAIKPCALMDDGAGYKCAREILFQRFGNTHLVTQHLINNLREGKLVKSPEDLQSFCDELKSSHMILNQMGRIQEVQSQSYILQVAERLQAYMKNRWKRRAMEIKRDTERYPKFEEFVEFVVDQTISETDPVYGKSYNDKKQSSKDTKKSSSSFTSDVKFVSRSKPTECVVCKGDHRLFYCEKFKQMTPPHRLQVVRSNKLCENCLLGNHVTADCRKNTVCTVPGCGGRHTKFIHINSVVSRNNPGSSSTSSGVQLINANVNASNEVHMPVVAVRVNNEFDTCTILDSASTNSFCTRFLINTLRLQGNTVKYSLNTLSSSAEVQSESVDLTLMSFDGQECLKASNVFVVDRIPFKSTCPTSDSYSHLKGLQFVAGGQNVHLLLGQDNSEALIPLEVRKGLKGQPFACRTLFGWSLNGADKLLCSRPSKKVITHFISSSIAVDVDKLWRIENEGLSGDELSWSVEDRSVINLWDGQVKLVEGHYELPIPWKENSVVPNNLVVALSRLKSLKSNLAKRGLFDKYNMEMRKLINNGYAEIVPDSEINNTGKIWYLPHQAVVTDKKPDKLRIVYDCAAKYLGESLNDKCLQGPDMNNKLFNVLVRFRQHQYAFTADIEAMYNQVRIPPRDRDALRFLWDGESGHVQHYRMTSHLFGGIWCASCATYAVRRTIVDFPADDAVVDTINRSFYVDDCLKSCHCVADVEQIIDGTRELLGKAGFKLTKFVVNDSQLLDKIPIEDRAKEGLDISALGCSKVLGVGWDVVRDQFYVNVDISPSDSITRKRMLSIIASCFDPLGLVSPMLVAGKILFQDCTSQKLGWDDPVPCDILEKWNKWVTNLNKLKTFRTPRVVKSNAFDDAAIELHFFSDASLRAYGACCYMRCSNKFGEISSSLLVSKARVAPIKSTTIPRLELQAAVLAAQMDSNLRRELDLQLNKSYFWTDSELVLKYIKNETRRFQVYVGNRVSIIRQLTDASQWFHVTGTENPADMLTRPYEYQESDKWFSGPMFLQLHKDAWKQQISDFVLQDDDPDVKTNVVVNATTLSANEMQEHPIEILVKHYSSWYRLKRAVAWLLRLKRLLKGDKHVDSYLSVSEVVIAEYAVLKYVQDVSYSKDIRLLASGKPVCKGSNIRNLSPFLAEDGLLRVGGRLNLASGEVCKNPILISHDHLLAYRIAVEYHNEAHLGPEWVLSRLRSRFWITKGRVILRKVSRDCVTCRKLFGSATYQIMSDLPFERLEPYRAPFTFTGMDCFGPFYVRQGRAQVKRYGCIFTCLSIRAVHIEKLNCLDTDAFLNAFRRFVARRGSPDKVYCDNGTNLVGGSRELAKSLRELQVDKIYAELVKGGIEWHFNPPSASHMGGIWERVIRTVRKVFTGLFDSKCRMSDEILETIFCEVEAIVNSRPITKLSEDPNDSAPLCPNQLLILRGGQLYPPCLSNPCDLYKRRWKFIQYIVDQFWRKWIRMYLPELQRRQKWFDAQRNFRVGDLVLLVDENMPRNVWPLGLVLETFPGRDGLIRSVKVKTKASQLTRPITKVVLLEAVE